jgi:signal recognition particle receptor subunit beta
MGDDSNKNIDCVDIPGHFNFRERIQEVLETAAGIVLVVDSKDK